MPAPLDVIYDRLVKHDARFAIDGLEFHRGGEGELSFWSVDTNLIADDGEERESWKGDEPEPPLAASILPEPVAAAMLKCHMIDMLPRGATIDKGESLAGTIFQVTYGRYHGPWSVNLLHALAEFHLPGSTKE